VQGQVRVIESLERSALTPGETPELAGARADLARLQVRFGPAHPQLQAQRRFLESLEQSTAANEPSDLAQAKAQLAKLRSLYGEGNPEVQAQLKKVAEIQR
jgi:capsule polysaccharide export protein KpsE/RkpR